MLILGIDTSCDETAAAVVRDGCEILTNVVSSQIDLHRQYGGVVPEVACRAHAEALMPVIDTALKEASVGINDLDAIAVTTTPGLIGALLVGLSTAKSLAWASGLPLIAVDHIQAHLYSPHFEHSQLEYPYVSLVVSGGHTALYLCHSPLSSERLGSTRDDAAGEAFDKVAAILGLPYPGGPAIQKVSADGDPKSVAFPRSKLGKDSFDFSFSGLKTAVLYHCKGQNAAKSDSLREGIVVADVAASFQQAAVDVLVGKTVAAAQKCGVKSITMAGGVSANSLLRQQMIQYGDAAGIKVLHPSLSLCTDNGAMVAGLAYHLLEDGRIADLNVDAKPQNG
jgi:N6-L-threonylcarbamoyladenine synthase